MSLDLLNYNVRSEAELEGVINGLGNKREIHKQIKRFGETELLETDERYRLKHKLYQLVLQKNSGQQAMAAQPPVTTVQPTVVAQSTGGQAGQQAMAAQPPATTVQPAGVPPSTGGHGYSKVVQSLLVATQAVVAVGLLYIGMASQSSMLVGTLVGAVVACLLHKTLLNPQSTPQSTMQTNVANVWTIDELYKFIADELNFDPKGPLSLVDMAKQHCLEKGIVPTKIELHAHWKRLIAKNVTSIKCWMGGIILGFTMLLYMTLLFEMERSENWDHDGPNKDIKAEEADNAFVNHCWRAVVFFLLVANSCFLCRHPKKLWNAFGAVLIILMIHLTMIYYHWSNDHISNEQGFMWSVPLAVVNCGFFLVVWCFN